MAIYTPPMNISERLRTIPTIFLGGTIDNGNSEDWQSRFTKQLEKKYNVLNPRRSDWDTTLKTEYSEPNFYQQVNWELNGLEISDVKLFYFLPNSKSPITLMELGKYGNTENTVVFCPDGYERKGNVDIFCDRYNIPLYTDESLLLMDLLTTDYERRKSKLRHNL